MGEVARGRMHLQVGGDDLCQEQPLHRVARRHPVLDAIDGAKGPAQQQHGRVHEQRHSPSSCAAHSTLHSQHTADNPPSLHIHICVVAATPGSGQVRGLAVVGQQQQNMLVGLSGLTSLQARVESRTAQSATCRGWKPCQFQLC